MKLWSHQKNALELQGSNWASGIHAHATGTGKSVLLLAILQKFIQSSDKKSPLILWICERKSILHDQCMRDTLRQKGVSLSDSIVFRYDKNKSIRWESIGMAAVWNRPRIVITTRAFLTFGNRYTSLNNRDEIDLILHDECHTVTNRSSLRFYEWAMKHYPKVVRVGFTATPPPQCSNVKRIFPHILSRYSIYQAVQNNHIVPPNIIYNTSKKNEYFWLTLIKNRPYKKVIVWTGMIEDAKRIAHEIKCLVGEEYLVSIDISSSASEKTLGSYEDFKRASKNAILICAAKHREGSDIPNLDTCVFMDGVHHRTKATFVQCVGRVLRRDPNGKKQDGWIIDPTCRDTLALADRIHTYLGMEPGECPWTFDTRGIIRLDPKSVAPQKTVMMPQEQNVNHLIKLFVRKLPMGPKKSVYVSRLKQELSLIQQKKLVSYIIRGKEVLQLAQDIPHVTRGSCGSSLVCYLMGISHVDPVAHNIRFARFLNEKRNSMPDLDFDFPHSRRNEIFIRIIQKWPGQVARISNHLHWHERSAQREAIRRCGMKTPISNQALKSVQSGLSLDKKREVDEVVKGLVESFRGYSLHCGGIVYFPDGIDETLLLESKQHSLIPQIVWDKRVAAEECKTKVDILSSRGLSQLRQCVGTSSIDWTAPEMEAIWSDEKTANMFASANNIGITFAESPLMRMAMMELIPRTMEQIAYCLAVIRPAAREALQHGTDKTHFVFDDDVIEYLSPMLNGDEGLADSFRRRIGKGKKGVKEELRKEVTKWNPTIKFQEVWQKFKDVGCYSFCKSHAISYAMLVWYLGYYKANNPKKFWTATLAHNCSAYRPWVHHVEAAQHGVYPKLRSESIYVKNRVKRQKEWDITLSLQKTGTWDTRIHPFYPGCYLNIQSDNTAECRGLIAQTRKKWWFVGYAPCNYIWIRFKSESKQPFQTNTPIIFRGVWDKKTRSITIGDHSENHRGFHGEATMGSSVVEPQHPL